MIKDTFIAGEVEKRMPKKNKVIVMRNVPSIVRRQLKAQAAMEGKTMQGLILELIVDYLKKRGASGLPDENG